MPFHFDDCLEFAAGGASGGPRSDVRYCKLDVAATAGLSVDQSLKACIRDEQKARQQLGSKWSKFPAASWASCAWQENIGGRHARFQLSR